MKISTKGRYALRMLLDLAEHQQCGYIALKDIAERQNISKKYVEQIIPVFNNSDILKTSRGAQGGYRLAKSPDQYTLGEILRLTEGSLAPILCAEQEPAECTRSEDCALRPVWQAFIKRSARIWTVSHSKRFWISKRKRCANNPPIIMMNPKHKRRRLSV